MSAVSGLLPKIEGFQPIPNAVMIPFMEAQSAALAYGFGLNYEYGKRKIRSMSNDEFNSLTSEDITNMSNNHTHIILSKFQLQVPLVMPMQKEIFQQYVIIEKEKVVQNVALGKWIVQNFPQLLGEGKPSDDPASLRETPSERLPIGTEKDGKVLVGYIDGVPQWRLIPTKPTPGGRDRRQPEEEAPITPEERFPVQEKLPLKKYSLLQIINPTTRKTATYMRTVPEMDKHIQALRKLQKTFHGGVNKSAPANVKDMVKRNIQFLKSSLFKATGKVF